MKMHLFPDEPADIIIQFLKKETVDVSRRIVSTGLFENVCYRLPDVFDLHAYIKCVRNGDWSGSFARAVVNSLKMTRSKLYSHINNDYLENIHERIYNIEALDFSSYRAVFAGGSNDIVTNILRFMHTKYPNCEINLYEEGIISYYSDKVGRDCQDIKKNHVYIYEPELAIYEHDGFVRIPKVSRDDKDFLRTANYIFNFDPKIKTIDHKILFFDDPSNPMPSYLKWSKLLANTIFRIPYKKHLPEHKLYLKQLEAYKILAQNAGDREILVKLHPRTEREFAKKEYIGKYSTILRDASVPWELFCCNCDIRDNIFVTDVSSAIYANRFAVEGEDTNSFVILAEYMGDWTFKTAKKFYEKFKHQKNDIYFPATKEEYIQTLQQIMRT